MNLATALRADLPSFHFDCMPLVAVNGRIMPVAKARWMARSLFTPAERLGDGRFMKQVLAEFSGLEGLVVHLVEGGDAVVPFQQGGRRAGQARGVRIHLPDRVEHGV